MANGYRIEYGPVGGSTSTQDVADDVFTYDQISLDPGTEYQARVRYFEDDVFSDWTEWVDVYTLTGTIDLIGQDIITAGPIISSPAIGQIHGFIGTDIVASAPAISQPTITQEHTLTGSDIEASNPAISQPTIAQNHVLISQDIEISVPIVSIPVLSQKHILVGTAVETSVPVIEQASIGQIHNLLGSDIVSPLPEITSSVIAQEHNLTSSNIETPSPFISQPTLSIVVPDAINLIGTDITIEMPIISSPALSQIHGLTGSDIITGISILTSPVLGQKHLLTGSDAITDLPVLSAPVLGQTHILVGSDIETNNIEISQPTLTVSAVDHVLVGTDIIADSPVVSSPVIQQIHHITGRNIQTAAVVISSPIIGPIPEQPELTPIKVFITNDTSEVTVTDLNTQTVTVIDAAPTVTLQVDEQPRVIVNSGIGGAYDTLTLLRMLEGALTIEQFESSFAGDLNQAIANSTTEGMLATLYEAITVDQFEPELKADILQLQQVWERIVTDPLLYESEIDAKIAALNVSGLWTTVDGLTSWSDAFETYVDGMFTDHWERIDLTAQEISFQVGELSNSIDGQITEKLSSLTMTPDEIQLLVSNLQTDFNNSLLNYSTITQTAYDINLLVDRLESGEWGSSSNTAQISINTQEISLRVQEILTVDGRVDEAMGEISIQAGLLELIATQSENNFDRIDTAEIKIDAVEGITSSHSQIIASQGYRITATETLMSNQWGVEIEEDNNGTQYVSGVKLLQHNYWLIDESYAVGNTVYDEGEVYECNSDHTSTLSNAPPSSVWTLLPDGVKSEFVFNVDQVRFGSPNSTPETLDEYTQTIADNTLDTFVSVTYDPAIANLSGLIDGKIYTWFQDDDPVGTSAWTAGGSNSSHEGDMWWNTSTKILKRYTGSGWSAAIEDQKAIEAYGLAENAEDLADQKRRVFVATPYPPYDVGDLWDRGGAYGLWRCKTSRASGSYYSTDWQRAADVTDEIVGAMAYEEMVSIAKLDSTVIQGGYIKTSLIQTSAIVIGDLSGADTFTSHDTTTVAGCPASTVAGWRYGTTTYINGGGIYTNTITANQIQAGTITANSGIIANAAITTANIANADITTAKIANAAITTAKIANAAITTAKIGDLEVDTLKIKDNAVTLTITSSSSSVAIITQGGQTYVHWSCQVTLAGGLHGAVGSGNVVLKAGTTTVQTVYFQQYVPEGTLITISLSHGYVRAATSGQTVYSLVHLGDGTLSSPYMMVMETKK
jgi:hypothetical protein